jgi:hypothetical protein
MRDTIDMAREAGFMLRAESVKGQSDWWECFDEAIEKLVALARADERDRAMRENAYVQAEREACAKVCDDMGPCGFTGESCAEAIRARGTHEAD